MAPVHISAGPASKLLSPEPFSSGLVQHPTPAVPYVPNTNEILKILFDPMIVEYFETPTDDTRHHLMPLLQFCTTQMVHQCLLELIKMLHLQVIHHHRQIFNLLQYIKALQSTILLK
jgi:hypothetical protein